MHSKSVYVDADLINYDIYNQGRKPIDVERATYVSVGTIHRAKIKGHMNIFYLQLIAEEIGKPYERYMLKNKYELMTTEELERTVEFAQAELDRRNYGQD